jgi:heme exporter protein CcmD
MPKYAEFVFAAYGLFAVVIGGYVALVISRTRAARRALEAMDRHAKPPGA